MFNRTLRKTISLVLIASIMLQACQSLGPNQGPYQGQPAPPRERQRPDCQLIGYLRLIGTAVFLNGTATRDYAEVCHNDSISTGNNSSAYLLFEHGGFVHFNQNTDPIFRLILDAVSEILEPSQGEGDAVTERLEPNQGERDVVIEILGPNQGKIFVATSAEIPVIVRNKDGEMKTLGTQFNINATQQRTETTVYQGAVQYRLPPSLSIVQTGEQVGLRLGKVDYRQRLTQAQMANVVRWRERFPFPENGQGNGQGNESIPQWIGAVAIGTILFLLDRSKSRDDKKDDSDSSKID